MRRALDPSVTARRLRAGFMAIRDELKVVVDHDEPARTEAESRASSPLVDAHPDLVGAADRVDLRDVPFVTLDPASSRDLDQAFHLTEASGGGAVLRYAIADVAAHVVPGGAIDGAARTRGQTLYAPDVRVALHPPALSEDAGSLLPRVDRLAVVWTLSIDHDGGLSDIDVVRAIVRSTAKLDYTSGQAALDAGSPHPQIASLRRVGATLQEAHRQRGAIELPEPAQQLAANDGGGWTLEWEPRHPIEADNAQLSLLTGRAAARLMLKAGTGLLRTLPDAPPEAHARLRRAAQALGIAWPDDGALPELLPTLDGTNPAHLAFFDECRTLLRGADLTPFDGTEPVQRRHAALATEYAHVTAPLRRLADRFTTECALAAHHGIAVPAWALNALAGLPELMRASGRTAGSLERSCIDFAEAVVLEDRLGERFTAAVIDTDDRGADCRIAEPPIRARATGEGLRAGSHHEIVLESAEPDRRRVTFRAA